MGNTQKNVVKPGEKTQQKPAPNLIQFVFVTPVIIKHFFV